MESRDRAKPIDPHLILAIGLFSGIVGWILLLYYDFGLEFLLGLFGFILTLGAARRMGVMILKGISGAIYFSAIAINGLLVVVTPIKWALIFFYIQYFPD
ncbi:MAG: hypothetical protein HY867_01850 [Chloroflexi bacterium]|nr:hypothetical protein [Chloroflexota bacterium]